MRLKRQGKELSSLISGLQEPLESAEIRLTITAPDFRAAGQAAVDCVLRHAAQASDWHIAPDNREGVRISFDLQGGRDNGWFLLRLSVHDPVLPLNLESDVAGGLHTMAVALAGILAGVEHIDCAKLQEFIKNGED